MKGLGDKRLSDLQTNENCRTGGEKGQVENDILVLNQKEMEAISFCNDIFDCCIPTQN